MVTSVVVSVVSVDVVGTNTFVETVEGAVVNKSELTMMNSFSSGTVPDTIIAASVEGVEVEGTGDVTLVDISVVVVVGSAVVSMLD